MRIFCPATLLLPSLLLRPETGPGATGAPIGPANSGPIERCAGYCAAVYLSWSTGPRGRVCHPHAASSAAKIVAFKDGTGRARLDAGRMPDQAQTRLKAT
ncbi:hypothetical protein MMAN_31850 [Mycobacterium mantenii]|uniref:Uncharacterized protein n=1 Tax=Mycobacterium mantenii TaxID=560555 RepID=A0ABN6ABZ3_MYCNT|nr:hypothetical protein MMAN_31850 [Mycobacterium mantenii]